MPVDFWVSEDTEIATAQKTQKEDAGNQEQTPGNGRLAKASQQKGVKELKSCNRHGEGGGVPSGAWGEI